MQIIQKGFTLIELMIVITIIGILAAIALPAYQDYIARAQVSEAINVMSGMKGAIAENYAENSQCALNATQSHFGIAQQIDIKGKYLERVLASDASVSGHACQMEAFFKTTQVAAILQGKSIILSMQNTSGSQVWYCFSNNIDPSKLPSACRVHP